ncbi:unnamed protein product [Amaranthus hypochondriacus]
MMKQIKTAPKKWSSKPNSENTRKETKTNRDKANRNSAPNRKLHQIPEIQRAKRYKANHSSPHCLIQTTMTGILYLQTKKEKTKKRKGGLVVGVGWAGGGRGMGWVKWRTVRMTVRLGR